MKKMSLGEDKKIVLRFKKLFIHYICSCFQHKDYSDNVICYHQKKKRHKETKKGEGGRRGEEEGEEKKEEVPKNLVFLF